MKRYCLGFLFSHDFETVVLIQKKRGPNSMAGKVNGVGGEALPNERLVEAMAREFEEEAAVKIPVERWKRFGDLDGGAGPGGYTVGLFYAVGTEAEIDSVRTRTDEEVCSYYLDTLCEPGGSVFAADGVRWMVQMAISHALGDDTSLYSCHRSTVLFS